MTSGNKNNENVVEEINITQIIKLYAFYWKWFVLSVFFSIAIGICYLYYATPQYQVDAKILLENEDRASGELSGLAELSSLTGGSGQSAFVMDQIDIFKSRRLLQKVIQDNDLTISIFRKENIKTVEIFNNEAPFRIITSGLIDKELPNSFTLMLRDEKSFSFKGEKDDEAVDYQFGQSIKTDFGTVVITPNGNLTSNLDEKFKIVINPINKVVDYLQKYVLITPNTEKQSYIVNFSLTGPLIAKSDLIIDNLIQEYNNEISGDKNKITSATSSFINSRLALIGRDLDLADKNVQQYKSVNNMTDLLAESELNLRTLTEADKDVLEKSTQVELVKYMRESIRKNTDLQLLPSNVGLNDLSIEKTIVEYNSLVLERDDLLKSSTIENPVVKNLTENIRSLNKNLIVSLDNYSSVLQLSLNSAENKKRQLQGRVSAIPSQELGFKEISRQQQTIEAIYLFLLQKREENEIRASARPSILKIIDSAYGSNIPVAPKKALILFGAFMLGILVPFGILYLKFLFDNKVHSRSDIEGVFSVPILVEVPSAKDKVVIENDRSSLAEAFRIMRTNLSFLLKASNKSNVIFVTSTISGEGKSFISTNLARVLAMSEKKVLLLGADIRSPKVLQYLGLAHLEHTSIGITQYLVNPDIDIDSIIFKKPEGFQFDIIYSGYIAPNPAELLMNGNFDKIIQYGREHYDYIIVDTAPVSLVTDTLLIADNADVTVYVTRANYLEKQLLKIPKGLYEDGKLKNMTVVLNDVDFARGYGYGYGYGYGEDVPKSIGEKVKGFFSKKNK